MSLNSRLSDSAVFVVEGDGAPAESPLKAFLSASVTLTLGILGSSVLPVPFAFSRLGVLTGLVVASIVSLANALTGTLLLRSAGHLGTHTFEALAYKAAGHGWKVVTEVSLVVLLFGTLCGDYALLADIGKKAVVGLFPDAPGWIHDDPGRLPMVVLGLVIVFPLSCLRRMRQLEYAAMAGVGLVVILAAVIVHSAVAAGFPAIHSGELPLAQFSINADLPEAVAVVSFAFYTQPMLLPLLKEMPQGRLGLDLTCKAVQLVTIVVAYIVYGIVGVFAAARYGLRTEGDILVNKWLPGRWDGALDALVAIYLSLSMVPMVMTMRYQLDSLLTGDYSPYLLRRELSLTLFSLLTSLAVALKWPTAAEKMFAVTGATGVCLVCYVVPVAIHLSLYFDKRGRARWRRRGSFTFLSSDALATVETCQPTAIWPPCPHAPPPPHTSTGAGANAGPAAGAGGALAQHVALRLDPSPAGLLEGPAQQQSGEAAGASLVDGAPGSPAGSAKPTASSPRPAAAQPLPVRAVPGSSSHAGGAGNISFDNWLVASRSKEDSSLDSDTLGCSPRSPNGGRDYRRSSLESVEEHQQQLQQPQQQQPPPPQWPRQRQQQPPPAQVQVGWQQADGALPVDFPAPAPPAMGSLRPPRHPGRAGHGQGQGLNEPLLPGDGAAAAAAGQEGEARRGKGGGGGGGSYPSVCDLEGQPRLRQALLLAQHVALPVVVMLVGSGCSLGALWLAVTAFFKPDEAP